MFEYTRLKRKIEILQEENNYLLKELDNKCTNIHFLLSRNNDLEKSNNNLKYRLEESEAKYASQSCSNRTFVHCHNRIYEENKKLENKIKELESELKFFKRENCYVMEACKDYIVIPVDEYEEFQDVYEKLSETEEQRKNMSQAYEDEYQTRITLQEENEKLKECLENMSKHYEIECLTRLTRLNFNKENKKLKE